MNGQPSLSRMLKQSASIVLASFRPQRTQRVCLGLDSLRPCWAACLSILRECSPVVPDVPAIEVPLCGDGFSAACWQCHRLHLSRAVRPCASMSCFILATTGLFAPFRPVDQLPPVTLAEGRGTTARPSHPLVEHRQDNKRQECRTDESADHHDGQRPLHFRADPAGKGQRHNPSNATSAVIKTGRNAGRSRSASPHATSIPHAGEACSYRRRTRCR